MQVDSRPRILRSSQSLIPALPKLELCILGGTGFVGKWLVNTLLQICEEEGMKATVHIVTRDIQRSKSLFPERFLKHIYWIEHDFKSRTLENLPNVDFYVYGSTPSVVDNLNESQKSLLRVTLNGIRSLKESILSRKMVPRVVNLSSGAVYEKARSIDSPCYEHDRILQSTSDFYTIAKIESEKILESMSKKKEISLLNLRLFSLYGPHLPLDKHFAIGNFMRDAITGREISIEGNRNTRRSYLYGADLAVAIISGLFSEYQGVLNIGGKRPVSMEELTNIIGLNCGGRGVNYSGENFEPNYYYPCISLSEEILGQYENTSLEEGLKKWKMWLLK